MISFLTYLIEYLTCNVYESVLWMISVIATTGATKFWPSSNAKFSALTNTFSLKVDNSVDIFWKPMKCAYETETTGSTGLESSAFTDAIVEMTRQ